MASEKAKRKLSLIELVKKARAGDDDALAQLMSLMAIPVTHALYKIVRPGHRAEDIAHDALTHAALKIQQCHARTEGQVAASFITIARNRAIDYLRSPEHQLDDASDSDTGVLQRLEYPEDGPAYRLEHNLLMGMLKEEMEQLATVNRELYARRYIEDQSWEEIANALRLTVPAAKQRAKRSQNGCENVWCG